MKIYEYDSIRALPIEKCVLALGFFDGVHIAHRDLLITAKNLAKEKKIPFGIFTFPAEDRLKLEAKRLYSTEERLHIFEELGADLIILADFSLISPLSPREFVKDVLIDSLGCEIAIAGFNYRFGKGAVGDASLLRKLMAEYKKSAYIREAMYHEGKTVSASLIRELLAAGDIKSANVLLGSPYCIFGEVTHGIGIGKKIGFPTVNTEIQEKRAHLKSGVYRTAISIDGEMHMSITNIGICPTFDERKLHAETYIIDFSKDIYGKSTRIYFLDYIREERRFDTAKELKMQINIDKNKAILESEVEKWQELGLK